MLRSRDLDWDGCLNVRDLGGHRTEDGGETRYGAVVRADSIRQLTDAGWATAVDYGVRTVVDLRTDEELEADPPAELPVDVVHVPFFQEDEEAFAEVEAAARAAPDYAAATRAVYLVFLERFGENVAAAIAAVARAPEGVVVVHCMGGKDRTGLVTASCSASPASTSSRSRPTTPSARKGCSRDTPRGSRRPARRPSASGSGVSLRRRPQSMVGVLEELERRHGSIEAYLPQQGSTEEDLRLARERLRG